MSSNDMSAETSAAKDSRKIFSCKLCLKHFQSAYNLKRHLRDVKHENKCLECDLSFENSFKLRSHTVKTHRELSCEKCGKKFDFPFLLKRHLELCRRRGQEKEIQLKKTEVKKAAKKPSSHQNPDEIVLCHICDQEMPRKNYQHHLRSYKHIEKASQPFSDDRRICLYQAALEGKMLTYSIRNISKNEADSEDILENIDVEGFLKQEAPTIQRLIEFELRSKSNIKFRIFSCGIYSKEMLSDGEVVVDEQRKFFYSLYREVNVGTSYLREIIDDSIDEVVAQCADFCAHQSGWSVVSILRCCVEVALVKQWRASGFLELPTRIKNIRGATLNVQNSDDKCFLYACLAHTFRKSIANKSDRRKASAYAKHLNYFNVGDLEWPLSVQTIRRFEELNSDKNISFTIFTLVPRSHNISSPIYRSKTITENHCMMLLIQNLERNQIHEAHYVLITNLSMLLSKQMSSHSPGRHYFCEECLTSFRSQKSHDRHIEIGCTNICYKIPKETHMAFKKHSARAMADFCAFIDIETNVQPLESTSKTPDDEVSYTNFKQKHVASSVAYSFHMAEGVQDEFLEPLRLTSGSDCIDKILDLLFADVRRIYEKHFSVIVPMKLTRAEFDEIAAQNTCGICEKPFTDDDRIAIDHRHSDGAVRFAKTHSKCNILLFRSKVVYVVAHNLSAFDGHLLILGISKKGVRLKVTAKSKETYISFSAYVPVGVNKKTNKTIHIEVRFIDSYRFLSASLANLVAGLDTLPCFEAFVKKTFNDENALSYVKKNKFFYPYEWQTSDECLRQQELPPIEAFYSSLTNSTISQADYDYCLDIYERLRSVHGEEMCMQKFSQFYLASDVYQLKDLFTAFRVDSMRTFKLDPLYFISLPSYAFEVLKLQLEKEGHKIAYLPEPSMAMWLRKNLKGGLSCAMKRWGISNTEQQRDYDPSKPRKSIHYYDINQLYSHVMRTCAMPYDCYEWLEGDEFSECASILIDYEKSRAHFSNDSEYSVFFEADVKVPKSLHNHFNCMPLLPENIFVGDGKTRKLVPNLHDKLGYVAHVNLFQHAQRHGLVVTNVKRILKFRQKKYLEVFMAFCTALRLDATSEFAKAFFKQIMNSIFGKFLQKANDLDVKLVTEWLIDGLKGNFNYAERFLRSPLFKSFTIFNSSFVAIEMQKTEVLLNNCTAIGSAILDLSKILLYDMVYEHLKPVYGPACELFYCDTDSVIFSICEEIYRKTYGSKHFPTFSEFIESKNYLFDTSNLSQPNFHNIPSRNGGVTGVWKSESKDLVILAVYALSAKCYSYVVESRDPTQPNINERRLKGVVRAVSKMFQAEDFRSVLQNKRTILSKMSRILSVKHELFTVEVNKISLNHRNDKRVILSNNCDTLAIGHYAATSQTCSNHDDRIAVDDK